MIIIHNICRVNSFTFIIKFTPVMVFANELCKTYRVNSFTFIIKFTPVMVSGNELCKMYRVNSFTFIIKFTLNIISGTEIPAVYRVNLLNPIDGIYSYHCTNVIIKISIFEIVYTYPSHIISKPL